MKTRLIRKNMANVRSFPVFALGLAFGVFVTYVITDYYSPNGSMRRYAHKIRARGPHSHDPMEFSGEEDEWEPGYSHGRRKNGTRKPRKPLPPIDFDADQNDTHHHGQDKAAKEEFEKVRILCWVMTSPKTLHTKGRPVKETWGKRCNKLLFMSSKDDPSFPAVGLDVQEGRENLWDKTRAAWKYVLEHHIDDADWFIKADDDTYVIVENLRHLVAPLNTEDPHYFGRYFKPFGGYCSGGAGYVFSRETLRRFGKLLKDPARCALKSFAEDVEVGRCLAKEGIHPGDSRDSRGRKRFHPLPPEHHLIPGYLSKDFWLWSYDYYPYKDGPECCSDHSITYHYISPNMMYQMEYFVYHLKPFGIGHSDHE